MPLEPENPPAPEAPSETFPRWRLRINGVKTQLAPGRIELDYLRAISTGGDTECGFSVVGGALPANPDPYLGKAIQVENNIDPDHDTDDYWIARFSGRCVGVSYGFSESGWTRSYKCFGLSYLAGRVPVTDPTDGTDLIVFNVPPDDFNYLPSRAGRTVGQMLRYVLDVPATARALDALGIGDLASAGGYGATATASVAGGGGLTVTVTNGGDDYVVLDPPRVILVGGDGTYDSATATVNAQGEVTAISVANPAAWTKAPEVWISPLPVVTLKDLAKLALVPPFPVYIQGEKLLDVLRGTLESTTRGAYLNVEPDGTLRVIQVGDFAGPTLVDLDDPLDRVDLPGLSASRSVESCFPRVRLRGAADVVGVIVELKPQGPYASDGGLAERFAHDGLTNQQAKNVWSLTDFLQPGDAYGRAQFLATVGAGKVTLVTISKPGYGYAPSTTYPLTFTGGGGSGAAATFTTNALGQAASVSLTNQGTSYTSAPTVRGPAPPTATRDEGNCVCNNTLEVTVTSDESARNWPVNYWDQTSSGRKATLVLTSVVSTLIDVKHSVPIVACEALAAGGSCKLTLATPLPALDYTRYEITGTAGGATDVWRKYEVTIPQYRNKMLTRFKHPWSYRWAGDLAVSKTSVPTATVLWSSSGAAPYMESPIGLDIDADAGIIRTHVPVVTKFGTYQNLLDGGANTDGIPANVKALLAINRGNLQAIKPADAGGAPQYQGTSKTVENLAETYTLTMPSWIDPAGQAGMEAYAQEVLDSVKDTHVEIGLPLLRYHHELVTTFGRRVKILSDYPTPWSNLELPVREVTLHFTWRAGSGVKYRTEVKLGNQRAPLAASFFARPDRTGLPLGTESGTFGPGGFWFAGRLAAAERTLENLTTGGADRRGRIRALEERLRELRGEY